MKSYSLNLINLLKYIFLILIILSVFRSLLTSKIVIKNNAYLANQELTNQELTDLVASLQEKIEKLENEKADQSALETSNSMLSTINQNIEIINSIANSSTLDKVYPVGSIYISTTDDTVAKVAARFGGTWEVYGNGRTLMSSTSASGQTGGASSVSYKPAGTVGNTTLTIDQIPSHTGHFAIGGTFTSAYIGTANTNVFSKSGSAGRGWTIYGGNEAIPNTVSLGGSKAHTHTFTGTSATIATQSPYITVYMYKRVS